MQVVIAAVFRFIVHTLLGLFVCATRLQKINQGIFDTRLFPLVCLNELPPIVTRNVTFPPFYLIALDVRFISI